MNKRNIFFWAFIQTVLITFARMRYNLMYDYPDPLVLQPFV